MAVIFVLALMLAQVARGAPFDVVPVNRDVSGDGLADVSIDRIVWDGGAGHSVGRSIVFGRRDGGSLSVQQPGVGQLWSPVASCDLSLAGDVNGDGRSDVLAACQGATADGRRGAGVVTVLFGRSDAGVLSPLHPGPDGFRILGVARGRHLGAWAASAGDVNGDGLADLLLGTAPRNDRQGPWAYVVLGRRAVADVDLATPDGSVTAVRLPPHSSYLEATGSGVGDVDGDGLGDLAFGDRYWPRSSCGQEDCSGRAWLVYGARRLPRRLSVLRLGARGYAIRSGDSRVLFDVGSDVRPAGDLNGDGRTDVLVDALYENGTEPFVVWGARRRDHPIGLSGQSARLAGRACCFNTDAVAIGDINGDGRDRPHRIIQRLEVDLHCLRPKVERAA